MDLSLPNVVMWVCGLLTHYAFVLVDMSAARKKVVTPWRFIKERPYKVFISLMGAVVGYAMLQDALAGAKIPIWLYFGVGYMANDNFDKITSIVSRTMPQTVVIGKDGMPEKIRSNDETIIDFKRGQDQ